MNPCPIPRQGFTNNLSEKASWKRRRGKIPARIHATGFTNHSFYRNQKNGKVGQFSGEGWVRRSPVVTHCRSLHPYFITNFKKTQLHHPPQRAAVIHCRSHLSIFKLTKTYNHQSIVGNPIPPRNLSSTDGGFDRATSPPSPADYPSEEYPNPLS